MVGFRLFKEEKETNNKKHIPWINFVIIDGTYTTDKVKALKQTHKLVNIYTYISSIQMRSIEYGKQKHFLGVRKNGAVRSDV